MSRLLEAVHLCRTAEDGTLLLDDISLDIPPGSSTAILGTPGSGKSLLLRSLGLLDPLQKGEVRFRGEPVADHDVPTVRRQVMLVSQKPVFTEGTVRENLHLPFTLGYAPTGGVNETRIIELLSQTGRDGQFLDRTTDDLSGGESQIVSLLRALQLDPVVLMLDEPTSSLDGQTTEIIETLIAGWQAENKERSVLIVTHTPAQAERMATRKVQLEKGSIVSVTEDAVEPA